MIINKTILVIIFIHLHYTYKCVSNHGSKIIKCDRFVHKVFLKMVFCGGEICENYDCECECYYFGNSLNN